MTLGEGPLSLNLPRNMLLRTSERQIDEAGRTFATNCLYSAFPLRPSFCGLYLAMYCASKSSSRSVNSVRLFVVSHISSR